MLIQCATCDGIQYVNPDKICNLGFTELTMGITFDAGTIYQLRFHTKEQLEHVLNQILIFHAQTNPNPEDKY